MSRTVHSSNTNFLLRGNKPEEKKKRETRTEANDCRANKIKSPTATMGFSFLLSSCCALLRPPYMQVEYSRSRTSHRSSTAPKSVTSRVLVASSSTLLRGYWTPDNKSKRHDVRVQRPRVCGSQILFLLFSVSNARLAAEQHLVDYILFLLQRNLPAEPLFRVQFIFSHNSTIVSFFFTICSRFFLLLFLLSRQATVTIVASNDSGMKQRETNE